MIDFIIVVRQKFPNFQILVEVELHTDTQHKTNPVGMYKIDVQTLD